MMDLKGVEIAPDELDMLKHPLVGGVILFTRNYRSPEQIDSLVTAIHNVRTPHLLVAVDHEGGRVQRFREGFTQLPPMGEIGRLYNKDPNQGKQFAELCGWLMAVELRAVGVDFSFAPVLDLDRHVSEVIGNRAFHRSPETVSILAQAFQRGMNMAGMSATGKHFPGHGAVEIDSHVGFPIDERPLQDILAEDAVPFERLIQNGLAGIMPAHVIYPQIDNHPAGFSPFWLKQILRNQLGFQGVIFSDDLSMEAASVAGDVVDRTRAAISAGCDMALVCNNTAAAAKVLDNFGPYNEPVSAVRLVRMHGRQHVRRDKLRKDTQWQKAVSAINRFAAGDSLELEL